MQQHQFHLEYTVDALLEKFSILCTAKKLWVNLGEEIKVIGRVEKIVSWRDLVYITLVGQQGALKVRTERQFAPTEGQYIIFSGMPTFAKSKTCVGLELVIVGKPEGVVESVEVDVSPITFTAKKTKKVLLLEWLKHHPLSTLVMLGTETALHDICTQVPHHLLVMQQVSLGNKEAIFTALQSLSETMQACHVVFARGGDDVTINIFDDPDVVQFILEHTCVFYTAIGHSHRLTLLDKYADESFLTPTDFGVALASRLNHLSDLHVLYDSNEKLCKELSSVREEHAKQNGIIQTLIQEKNGLQEQRRQLEIDLRQKNLVRETNPNVEHQRIQAGSDQEVKLSRLSFRVLLLGIVIGIFCAWWYLKK